MVTLTRPPATTVADAELPRSLAAEHLMSMPALRRHVWTLDEVDRLADERAELSPRYELLDGELLVTPSPSDRHQRIVAELFVLIHAYVHRSGIGEVRLGPARARVSPDSRFEPDIFVVAGVDGHRPRANDAPAEALLVVEVLSSGSARHDRVTKRRFFQRQRVLDYWVVDGDARVFEIWHPDDERAALIDERVVWRPRGSSAPFELHVADFFAGVADSDDSDR